MTLILDDFLPVRLVSANKRIHHMVRAQVCAYWRQIGLDFIRDNYGVADPNGGPWYQKAHIVVTFRFPTLIRRDVHNYYPYVVKPLVDGFIDAQLLLDDSDRYLIGPDVRRDLERGPHRLTIDIEDAP